MEKMIFINLQIYALFLGSYTIQRLKNNIISLLLITIKLIMPISYELPSQ